MKKVLIKWLDRKNGEIIVRSFNGFLESETEEKCVDLQFTRLL
jgi:hypothetical protein